MNRKVILTNEEVVRTAALAANCIPTGAKIYGVPRGGIPVAYLLAGMVPLGEVVDTPEGADVVVDDILDSGATRDRYPDKPFVALYGREMAHGFADTNIGERRNGWLVFPWEQSVEGSTEDIATRLLQLIGEDPTREGLRETPARFVRAWKEWTSGYGQDPADVLKTFEDGAEDYDEMVIVDPIPFYTHCEHHLAAVFGSVHIAYIPNKRIVGLSKLIRLTDIFMRRLQVQARMTTQIANAIMEHLEPVGVGVITRGRHFCMESRGVRTSGTETTKIALRGVMKTDPAARMEFLTMVKGR